MTSLKICFENEIRRVLLRSEDGNSLPFNKLMNTLYNLFPALTGQAFLLTWQDDEGDIVVCSSDAELEDAIHVMKSQSKLLRFNVRLETSEANTVPASNPSGAKSNRTIHANVTCDECGVKPIVGIRYKCAIRADFDLCEACEAKRIQPYPMIKITDPSQAPHILIYGLADGTRNQEGGWQRGWRGHGHPHHHPHGHPQMGHPQWSPQNTNPFTRSPAPAAATASPAVPNLCGRRGWHRRWIPADTVPVENSLGVTVNSPGVTVPEVPATKTELPLPDQLLEEQLIEKAIAESLEINDSKAELIETEMKTNVESKPIVRFKPANEGPPVNLFETTKALAAPSKPFLRFVKDVTFPDGTIVQPGASFRKVWKVRNDGSSAWPEGAVLVSVGGDTMGDANHKEPLVALFPDQEVEVAMQLSAPVAPGMYTSYFRAQTKDQQYFGQRLWASIVVADQEPDWHVVTQKLESAASTPTTSAPTPVVSAPTANIKSEETSVVQETTLADSIRWDTVPNATAPVSSPNFITPDVPNQQAPAHLRSSILLWRRELDILNEMGFSDAEVALPLLQQHLRSPTSLSGDKNARPNAEGMQQVIATLLSLTSFP